MDRSPPSPTSELRAIEFGSSLPAGAFQQRTPRYGGATSSQPAPPPHPHPADTAYMAASSHTPPQYLAAQYAAPSGGHMPDQTGGTVHQESVRRRALPQLPGQGGGPPVAAQQTTPAPRPQGRRALPTPPTVPTRPPAGYNTMSYADMPPAQAPPATAPAPVPPAPAYATAPPPLPKHASTSPPAATSNSMYQQQQQHQQQAGVQRSTTSSTYPTTNSHDSFFPGSSPSLTPNTSVSSRFSGHQSGLSHEQQQPKLNNRPSPVQESAYPVSDNDSLFTTHSDSPVAYSINGDNYSHATPQQYDMVDIPSRIASLAMTHGDLPAPPPREHTLQHQRSFHSEATSGPSTVRRSPSPLNFPAPHPAHQSAAAASSSRPEESPTWAEQSQSRWVQTKLLLHQQGGGYYDAEDVYDEYEDSGSGHELEEEVNEIRFFNPAFLSETAVQLRDRVIRGHHVKGGITWVGTFTGKDLVTTIHSFLPAFTRDGPLDRRIALTTALSLQKQLWVMEVDWVDTPIRDSSDSVFKFMSEMEGMDGQISLPTGVLTMATKCYSPSCTGDSGCYSPRCPWKTPPNSFIVANAEEESGPARSQTIMVKTDSDWTKEVDPIILAELSDQQKHRQTLIRQAILTEEKYEADLAALENIFITPLLMSNPPVIEPYKLEKFVATVFGNVVAIRRASRRLIDNYAIRLREQAPLIRTVGDIVLESAADDRGLYPEYTDNLPRAEEMLQETLSENKGFQAWVDTASCSEDHRWDLRYLLKRPATYLQQYPATLEEILKVTPGNDPDYDFLHESLNSIRHISYLSQLKMWHAFRGRGPMASLEWHQIVPPELLQSMEKKEQTRQMLIFEVIKGELEYVADLEAIEKVYVNPLREADTPIIDRSRVENFIDEAFHNYRSLLEVHTRLLEDFEERQLEQHPNIGSISDIILNAALNWHEAYIEYMPHYPLAKAKIQEERDRNPLFARFLDDAQRNPLTNRNGFDHFIYRPIPRLLRYPLLLKEVLGTLKALGRQDNPDYEAIPQIVELIDNLAKAGQKGVAVNTAKVELWAMKSTLDGGKFGARATKDLDLMNPMRELIHKGKVYRQPENSIGGQAWSELQLLLFDNYFVLVKQSKATKNKDASPRYTINRRPTPLELLSLGKFNEPPQNRSLGLLKGLRGGGGNHDETAPTQAQVQSDSRMVYPFTYSFMGQGAASGEYTLWTDSETARKEWHEKLNHALVLRQAVNDSGKVFEMTPLSTDTFYMAPGYGVTPDNDDYTGRVTCSVPFVTVDRRNLVAVGCEQGVWIGVRHDSASLRKVLHVRGVTNIAVLEEFGIFLVLADKSLLAYHLEALVPTSQSGPPVRSAPQRLSGVRDIVFFCVGQISGRTLVCYMKRKGMDSVFRVLEPILNRQTEDTSRQRRPFGALLGQRTEWFRVYKDFFIPTEALHLHFLKAKVAIVCAKGFEIMDLTDLKGGSIPIFDAAKARERPALQELARRCENARPVAMFRSTDSEFLLCYDAFGIYVDRHGEPNRDHQAIEWEGRPDSIVFHPPYLLLISPSFVEVRHIDSAKLLQIYTGREIRCTWDGTGGMSRPPQDAPGPKGWGSEVTSQEPRIHICKRTEDSRRTKGIEQQIFELTPTLLLNNPLLNPMNTNDPNYFPPAPLNHRTSMSTTHSNNGYGYLNPSAYNPSDVRSVSSASTNNYANSQNYHGNAAAPPRTSSAFPAGNGFTSAQDNGYYGADFGAGAAPAAVAGNQNQNPSGAHVYRHESGGYQSLTSGWESAGGYQSSPSQRQPSQRQQPQQQQQQQRQQPQQQQAQAPGYSQQDYRSVPSYPNVRPGYL